jgi:quercetin dioxygenase-like cupin family protein
MNATTFRKETLMNVQCRTRAGLVRRATLAALAVLAVAVVTLVPQHSNADHGLPHPVLLGRGPFIDPVAVQIRVKPDGQPTEVINVHDASEVVVLQITIQPGVTAPWHAHWGPAILVNAGPGTLTTVSSHDCEPRQMPPGSAVIDRGGVHLHTARNMSNEDVVLYVTFLAVPPGQGPVIPADPPAGCNPF